MPMMTPLTRPTSSAATHHAPERAEAADHADDEGRRDDLLAHRRMHGIDRRQQHAGEAGQADAEAGDRRSCRAAARCRARRPCRGSARRRARRGRTRSCCSRNQSADDAADRDREQHRAVVRIDEVADERPVRAAPAESNRTAAARRRSCAAPARRPWRGRRSAAATGSGRRDRSAGTASARSTMPISATATGETTSEPPKPICGRQHDREVGADRVERAMREIDDAAEREDQRQAERDQQVIDAVEQAVEHLLDEEHGVHGIEPFLRSRCAARHARREVDGRPRHAGGQRCSPA